jgi:hypothetical protein
VQLPHEIAPSEKPKRLDPQARTLRRTVRFAPNPGLPEKGLKKGVRNILGEHVSKWQLGRLLERRQD